MKTDGKKRLLIVVDMQNDFITGSLGTREAKTIVPGIAGLLQKWDGDVVFTKDTHQKDYLRTREGQELPVPHCIDGTEGHNIVPELRSAAAGTAHTEIFEKNTFGSRELMEWLRTNGDGYRSIMLCGVCTGICVISNAVIARTALPEMPVYIIEDLCACVTPASHETALKAMKLLQMGIVRKEDL